MSSLCLSAASDVTTILVLGWFPEKSFAYQRQRVTTHLLRAGLREGVDYNVAYYQVRSQEETDRLLQGRDALSTIVFTPHTSPGHFVRASGTRVPHVFQTFSDPVADGWIESYSRPGGNRTGVVEHVPVHGKRLDLLQDLVPGARRIAVVFEATSVDPGVWRSIKAYRMSRPESALVPFKVEVGETAEAIAVRLKRDAIHAVYVPLAGQIDDISKSLFEAVRRAALPAITERHQDIPLGAVMALQVDRSDASPGVAHQLSLVLRKASAGDIPVLSPRRYVLALNPAAARRMGIDIPRGVLRKAEVVVSDAH